ncbi:alpha-amylase family glycosyl hydrolase [Klebsiella pneumoniae]|uniref:alpha-amylase family glycosyl hydrolase n=1 Tax=Klebsiella pneumoniae TaxID=573 RepID=UPI002265BF15|nr:alpha-amylase family glycosyl hydrolase [Klebsiella pneumoniae]
MAISRAFAKSYTSQPRSDGALANSFYLTPLQDDGYDISDHLQPDPRFGTIADVIELIARARELGLRVIVELVIQHTRSTRGSGRRAIPGRRGGRIICGPIGRRKTTILPCFRR